MAKAKVEQVESVEAAPASVPEYSPAQLHKQAELKAKKEREDAKREEVYKSIKEQAKAFGSDLRGTWIMYTERNGTVSPAMVLKEEYKAEGEGLKAILTLLVYSPNTSQPYRAEAFY